MGPGSEKRNARYCSDVKKEGPRSEEVCQGISQQKLVSANFE